MADKSIFNDSVKIRDPSQQKRKKARAAVSIPAEFQITGQKDFQLCTVVDIGSGGLNMMTKSSLYVGDTMVLRFKIGHSPFETRGVVSRAMGKSVGIQFDGLSEEDQSRLQDYIHSIFMEKEHKKP